MSLAISWIAFFYVCLFVLWLTRLWQLKASARRRILVMILSSMILYPALHLIKPADIQWTPWKPPIQVFEKSSPSPTVQVLSQSLPSSLSSPMMQTTLPGATDLLTVLMTLGALLFLGRFLREALTLSKLEERSGILKHQGRLKIFLSPEIQSPFSVWPARIFLPVGLKRSEQKISLLHEIQHLRQGDLSWTLCQDFLCCLFFFLPGRNQFHKHSEEIFETACDEALLGKQKVSPQEYSSILIQFIQKKSRLQPVGSAGMAAGHQQLKRRLEMIFSSKNKTTPWISRAIIAGTALLMTTSALALSNLVKDRPMNLAQLKTLVTKSQEKTDVPLIANQEILAALNGIIENPKGRAYFRKSLARMKPFESMIQQQLKQNNQPEILLAVPLIESGYQNIDNKVSAGIWQIIPETARSMGLVVDEKQDERFNPEKSTQAALKYMMKNQNEFQDWHLTMLAYNSGEKALAEAIDNAGHRNAFQLLREGYLHPESRKYLPKVMAAILIYLNPDLVQ